MKTEQTSSNQTSNQSNPNANAGGAGSSSSSSRKPAEKPRALTPAECYERSKSTKWGRELWVTKSCHLVTTLVRDRRQHQAAFRARKHDPYVPEDILETIPYTRSTSNEYKQTGLPSMVRKRIRNVLQKKRMKCNNDEFEKISSKMTAVLQKKMETILKEIVALSKLRLDRHKGEGHGLVIEWKRNPKSILKFVQTRQDAMEKRAVERKRRARLEEAKNEASKKGDDSVTKRDLQRLMHEEQVSLMRKSQAQVDDVAMSAIRGGGGGVGVGKTEKSLDYAKSLLSSGGFGGSSNRQSGREGGANIRAPSGDVSEGLSKEQRVKAGYVDDRFVKPNVCVEDVIAWLESSPHHRKSDLLYRAYLDLGHAEQQKIIKDAKRR